MSKQNKEPKVNVFRLSVTDAETHRAIKVLTLSRVGIFVTLITISVLLLAMAFSLFAFTPLRMAIPGYPDGHARRAVIQNAIRADSLEQVVKRWELYSENLLRVLDGAEPLSMDSILTLTSAEVSEADGAYLASRDSLLRETVSDLEQFELDGRERNLPIEGVHFFVPLKGAIVKAYDPVLHPFLDISAPDNSVVMSILDGTVIFDGWMDDFGYVIQVQHANDLISVYRHNQKLLRKAGDRVTAGAPIALIGNSGSDAGFDHLHFELWSKGDAVDPTKFINF